MFASIKLIMRGWMENVLFINVRWSGRGWGLWLGAWGLRAWLEELGLGGGLMGWAWALGMGCLSILYSNATFWQKAINWRNFQNCPPTSAITHPAPPTLQSHIWPAAPPPSWPYSKQTYQFVWFPSTKTTNKSWALVTYYQIGHNYRVGFVSLAWLFIKLPIRFRIYARICWLGWGWGWGFYCCFI